MSEFKPSQQISQENMDYSYDLLHEENVALRNEILKYAHDTQQLQQRELELMAQGERMRGLFVSFTEYWNGDANYEAMLDAISYAEHESAEILKEAPPQSLAAIEAAAVEGFKTQHLPALLDRSYANGVRAGWNAGVSEDVSVLDASERMLRQATQALKDKAGNVPLLKED